MAWAAGSRTIALSEMTIAPWPLVAMPETSDAQNRSGFVLRIGPCLVRAGPAVRASFFSAFVQQRQFERYSLLELERRVDNWQRARWCTVDARISCRRCRFGRCSRRFGSDRGWKDRLLQRPHWHDHLPGVWLERQAHRQWRRRHS